MARCPDGSGMFHSPSAGAGELASAANRPGLRHVAFKGDDVRGVVDRVRGPVGDGRGDRRPRQHLPPLLSPGTRRLIVELAERLDGAPV
jgi:hypothetical protein